MNTTHNRTVGKGKAFLNVCSVSCQKVIAKLQGARKAVFEEFRPRIQVPERLLHLTLNEAEALAQETGFPMLVFPALAREKAESLAAWNRRQQALRAPAFDMAA